MYEHWTGLITYSRNRWKNDIKAEKNTIKKTILIFLYAVRLIDFTLNVKNSLNRILR